MNIARLSAVDQKKNSLARYKFLTRDADVGCSNLITKLHQTKSGIARKKVVDKVSEKSREKKGQP